MIGCLIFIILLFLAYTLCIALLPYVLAGALIYAIAAFLLTYYGKGPVTFRSKEDMVNAGFRGTRSMSDDDFARYLCDLYKRKKLNLAIKKEFGDQRATIIMEKKGLKCAMQIRRQKSLVSAEAVEDVLKAMEKYDCGMGTILSDSHFTPEAKELAQKNSCFLVEREEFAMLMLQLKGVKMRTPATVKKYKLKKFREYGEKEKARDKEYQERDKELEDYDYLDWLHGEDRPWIGPQDKK